MHQMNLPWVESPFFNEILKNKNLSEADQKIALEYHTNGFVVIPNLFAESLIDDVKAEMDNKGFNFDFPVSTHRDKVRIQDLWMYSESVKQVASHPKVLATLEMLYDREPIPFQTLNFKVGTQQRAHSDTIHFSSIPARFMCGVWVALEDITPENGAVFYYAKSHKMPEYNFAHFKKEPNDTSYSEYNDYESFIESIMNVSDFEKKHFYAKKGDALIWSSNIIHGGSKVENLSSTRYSQVTHYYFQDCLYYTPMLSNMVTNELHLRNDFIDIKSGKTVEPSFNGHRINHINTDKGTFILNNRLKNLSTVLKFIRLKNRIFKKIFS